MSFFSIIIPTYNSEKYIERTIQSVIDNDFDDFKIEIYDDGSTDNTIKKIKSTFNNSTLINVHVLDHCGPANIKNAAMQEVDGEYVMFLDSDDLLSKSALRMLYQKIEKANFPDLVIFNLGVFTDCVNLENVITKKISIELMENNVTNKVYKNGFLQKNKFPENTVFEDVAFCINAVLMSKNTLMIPNVLYHYRKHEGSITTKKQNALRRLDILKGYESMIDIESVENIDSSTKRQIYTIIAKTIFGHIKKSFLYNEEHSRVLFKSLYEFMDEKKVISNSQVSKKWRMKYYLLRWCIKLNLQGVAGYVTSNRR